MLPLVIVTLTLVVIAVLGQFPNIADVTIPVKRTHSTQSLDKCKCRTVTHLSHYIHTKYGIHPIYLKYKHICPKCKQEARDARKKEETNKAT